MHTDWDFYALRVDDRPAAIFVDLALASVAPIATAPVMAYVSLALRAPRADGLSSQDEFDALVAVEQSLEAALAGIDGTIYAGRCTTAGYRDFYFYAADPEAFSAAAAQAMRDHPAYACQIGQRDDAAWSVYRDFLFPGGRDLQRIHNRRVVEALEHHGDRLSAPRSIDHRAYMPNGTSADALQINLFEQGFSVEVHKGDGSGDVTVDFKRVDAPAEIDAVVIPLFDLICELGGRYDGWGCEVESEAP